MQLCPYPVNWFVNGVSVLVINEEKKKKNSDIEVGGLFCARRGFYLLLDSLGTYVYIHTYKATLYLRRLENGGIYYTPTTNIILMFHNLLSKVPLYYLHIYAS